MDNSNLVLRWESGAGWLILSGGPDALSDIRAEALSRMIPDGEIIYIGVDEAAADDLIEDMGELGATTGFLVNVLIEDDNSIASHLSNAALVVIPAEIDPRDLHSVLQGAAIKAIREAYQRGAVILIEGDSSAVFGHLYVVDGMGYEGFGWLQSALIVPGVTSINESAVAQDVLAADAAALAVGVGMGSALALGPQGQVETWGHREVTLALGRGS